MPKENSVTISRDSLLRALSHLEVLVVSLDRIGSASYQGEDISQVLIDFHKDWDVLLRLAECRRILSEPFSTEIGDDDMEELEREMKDVPYWKFDTRRPPDLHKP